MIVSDPSKACLS